MTITTRKRSFFSLWRPSWAAMANCQGNAVFRVYGTRESSSWALDDPIDDGGVGDVDEPSLLSVSLA